MNLLKNSLINRIGGDQISYEKLIDNQVFSFSRLRCYEECPYEYYLSYIEKDPNREKRGNFAAQNGSAMHKVFEELLTNKLPLDNCNDRYLELFEEIDEYTSSKIMDGAYEKCALYLNDLKPLDDKYEILAVEKKFNFKVDKYKFIGFADLIIRDKSNDEIILVDHKSSKHFLKKNGSPLAATLSEFQSYKKQMYLYCKAIRDCMHLQVSKIVWHHFKDNGLMTVIPFDEIDYSESLNWAVNVIERIKKDEEFPAIKTFYRCKELCPYRDNCEYLEDEDEEI